MGPSQVVELVLDVVAVVPGAYSGAASRAFLYYTSEEQHWVQGLKVTVEAAGGAAAVVLS